MNRNHNTKERKPGIVYARFAGTFVLCALLGAVAGFCIALAGEAFLQLGAEMNKALARLGLWWFAPGYGLLALATIYYLRGRALLPQTQAEDDAFREADRRLCLSLLLSGAAMVWMFIAAGIATQAPGNQGNGIVPLLLLQLVWIIVAQALTIQAVKVIYPEKRGNVFDSRFQKDWFQSCDEAERHQIGQCSIFSFRVMSGAFLLAMLALFFLASSGMAQPGWILLVGGLWMIQQMSYQCMAYHLDHGKKKGMG